MFEPECIPVLLGYQCCLSALCVVKSALSVLLQAADSAMNLRIARPLYYYTFSPRGLIKKHHRQCGSYMRCLIICLGFCACVFMLYLPAYHQVPHRLGIKNGNMFFYLSLTISAGVLDNGFLIGLTEKFAKNIFSL